MINDVLQTFLIRDNNLPDDRIILNYIDNKPISIVSKGSIKEVLKKCTRVELFIDEDTQELFLVDKGDLETYWLRQDRERRKDEVIKKLVNKRKQEENPFLK